LKSLSFPHRAFPDSIFVVDNLIYHHAGVIIDYASLTCLRLFFLPPYSPDLNPIERVWRFVKKRATHKLYFE
jgi:putative transposase